MKSASGGALGTLANYMSVFSGGALGQSTIFSLGIMPYISASIIMQLMGTVVPSLEKLKKEGEPGMRKINEWTRYMSVGVCIIQSFMWLNQIRATPKLLHPFVAENYPGMFMLMGVIVLTAGSMFLMWLGEQIDQFGIGNGVSLIITAGIVARMPDSIFHIWNRATGTTNRIGPGTVLFLICCFVFVVAGSIYLTEAQRRIKIQQAKHMRGRRVYGGSQTYLPLRVNHAGVMPIIFASSLMIFPAMGVQYLDSWANSKGIHGWFLYTIDFLTRNLRGGYYIYEVIYCIMIFFFSYFWNTVQFQPKEMANQLRDYGSFIPGLRPGKRTADYLEAVMNRITYVGAAFLCVIAVIPSVVGTQLLGGSDPRDFQATQFLGGTGLLIVISVMLDLVNRIEANLVMRNYSGFMEGGSGGGSGSAAKLRRPKGGPKRGPTQPQPAAFNRGEKGGPKGLPA
jgi:preprotein translocase subunit SecY